MAQVQQLLNGPGLFDSCFPMIQEKMIKTTKHPTVQAPLSQITGFFRLRIAVRPGSFQKFTRSLIDENMWENILPKNLGASKVYISLSI